MPTPPADRPPLDLPTLSRAAAPWTPVLLPETTSTNEVAAEEPVRGRVVVAEHQSAGRGRLDRRWEAPARSALVFSAVVDPGVPDARWPLLPLVTGLAVAEGVRRLIDLDVRLKWPNDVLVEDRKLAGILVERVQAASGGAPLAVIGVGLNVDQRDEELPVPSATSLRLEGERSGQGRPPAREELLGAVLAALTERLEEVARSPEAALAAYRGLSSTVGRMVDVHLPDGSVATGEATGIDDGGRLVVRPAPGSGAPGPLRVGAGDVVHVRPRET